MRARRTLAVRAILIWAAFSAPSATAEPWVVFLESGGHVRGTLSSERAKAGDGWETRERVEVALSGAGAKPERLRVEVEHTEAADGRVLAWSRAISQGGVRRELRAQRRGAVAHVSGGLGAEPMQRVLPAPERWLGPVALGAEIEAMLRAGAGSVTHRELAADGASFDTLTLTPADAPPLAGGLVPLDERTRTASGEERGLRVAWDPRARRLIAAYGALGTRFQIRPRKAFELAPAVPLDAFDGQLVASPFRISRDAALGTLRFALETEAGAPLSPPETAEQAVVQRAARTIVTICADCGSEPPPSAAALAAALAPTPWIESTAPRLVRMARRGIDDGAPIDKRMRALVRKVQKRLNAPVESLGYATALEALASRRGDCGEFTLLLAAFARANGIRARVVYGLVYSSRFTGRAHVFSPHAWVQAWDGTRWVSYDAGAGPFDATHIALALGDGSPESFADVTRRLSALRIVDAARIEAAEIGVPVNAD